MGVLRSGARGNMPATAKRLASWRVLKEMLQSFLRRCSLLDVLESLTVGTCVQHFFQVLSRGGGSLAQVFACPGHNFFFPCPILRFACPVFVDKCNRTCFQGGKIRLSLTWGVLYRRNRVRIHGLQPGEKTKNRPQGLPSGRA